MAASGGGGGSSSSRWQALQAHAQAAADRLVVQQQSANDWDEALAGQGERRMAMGPPTGYVDLENVESSSLHSMLPEVQQNAGRAGTRTAAKTHCDVCLCLCVVG
jgi:hypothetical protein